MFCSRFFLADFELFWLLFHHHFHHWGVSQVDRVRVHPPSGSILSIRIQSTGSTGRGSVSHLFCLQVRIPSISSFFFSHQSVFFPLFCCSVALSSRQNSELVASFEIWNPLPRRPHSRLYKLCSCLNLDSWTGNNDHEHCCYHYYYYYYDDDHGTAILLSIGLLWFRAFLWEVIMNAMALPVIPITSSCVSFSSSPSTQIFVFIKSTFLITNRISFARRMTDYCVSHA